MMITVKLSPKQINILMQALRIASEDGSIYEYAKQSEIEILRTKLSNVKD